MDSAPLIQIIQDQVPTLLAIYAFDSKTQGTAEPESDLDLAIFVEGYAEPLQLWNLADVAGCHVDLLDLRATSTIMQYQIVTTGQRWWAKDSQAVLHEAAILSEKTALDSARADLINDIQQSGNIYGG